MDVGGTTTGTVLIAKLFDWLVPLPALPELSLKPAMFKLIALLPLLRLLVGVSVAVQVLPPSLLARLDKVPLATLMSERSKPLTTSLKANVTSEVWPTPRFGLATTTVAVGSSPLVTLRSDRSKLFTASLKVNVTSVFWPMPRFGLATTIVAVGRVASSA